MNDSSIRKEDVESSVVQIDTDEEPHSSRHGQVKRRPEERVSEEITSSRSLDKKDVDAKLYKIVSNGDMKRMQKKLQNLDPSLVTKQINKKYEGGKTLLHYAAWQNHFDMCKLLVEEGAEINVCDKDNRNALHHALDLEPEFCRRKSLNISLMTHLLEKGATVDAKDSYGCTPLYYAAQNGHKECTELWIKACYPLTAFEKEMDKLPKPAIVDKDIYKYDDYGLTFLYLAAAHKDMKIFRLVVEKLDISICDEEKGRTALHYLVGWSSIEGLGFFNPLVEILKILKAGRKINVKDDCKNTPLHLACKEGRPEVVQALLKSEADVTIKDKEERNALDLAIIFRSASCARVILQDQRWKEALRSRDLKFETPMGRLIREMPEIAEEVFGEFIKSDEPPGDYEKNHFKFHYEFLDDEFCCWSGDNEGAKVFDDNGQVVKGTEPYHNSSNQLKENHPLNIMVKARRKKLLRHPLVTSLLNYKWKTFVRPLYTLNLILYLMFMVFFNLYMLRMPPPFSIDSDSVTPSCVAVIPVAQPSFGRCYDYYSWGIVAKYFVIVLSVLNILKEPYKIYMSRSLYFQCFTNYLKVLLYVLAIATVCSDTNSAGYVGIREDWQWQIGAVGIFLSWMVLIMFLRDVPRFGIYVLMFEKGMIEVFYFFAIFVLFIFGFAFSFHCLLQNQYAFQHLWNAVIKTSLMLIGEFQFEDIFVAEVKAFATGANNHTIAVSTVNYRAVSYFLFTIFVIIMSIIIINLVVAVVVSVIETVQRHAVDQTIILQITQTLNIQYALPVFIRRCYLRKYWTFFPHRYHKKSTLIRWWHSINNLNLTIINEALSLKKNQDQVESSGGNLESFGGKKRLRSMEESKFEFVKGESESLEEKE